MKGLHKPVNEVFNTIYRHESKFDTPKFVALTNVSRALHYSKQGRDPVMTLLEINDREAMKQGKSFIYLFYPSGYKCSRGYTGVSIEFALRNQVLAFSLLFNRAEKRLLVVT